MAKTNATAGKRNKFAGLLNRDHYDAIDAALRKLADLPDIIDNAELCDVDCKEYREAHGYFSEKLQKIKDKFFPQGRPAS